ncbi:DUF5679 domain-containing protein [Dictyobacter arantiisoli]|uniref:DUF5679 domain-containing protein n=1 Tax=Dictyobacter arantiisoli TaxID=2014874 RepID=A0A5A5TCL0_9CHLR|nr:DUF5679 domain-containing protein [Dictyobacter arantiisoli]GCF09048.1 hypothetical protein KDI_26120 [Dictyobacter arantiisoli]
MGKSINLKFGRPFVWLFALIALGIFCLQLWYTRKATPSLEKTIPGEEALPPVVNIPETDAVVNVVDVGLPAEEPVERLVEEEVEPAVVEPESLEQATEESLVAPEAYCVKCRIKRGMQNPKQIVTKNGRNAMEGVCPVCNTRLFRFVAAK